MSSSSSSSSTADAAASSSIPAIRGLTDPDAEYERHASTVTAAATTSHLSSGVPRVGGPLPAATHFSRAASRGSASSGNGAALAYHIPHDTDADAQTPAIRADVPAVRARVEQEQRGLTLLQCYASVVEARGRLSDLLKNQPSGHRLAVVCGTVQRTADLMLTLFHEALQGMGDCLSDAIRLLEKHLGRDDMPPASIWVEIRHACNVAASIRFDAAREFRTPVESGLSGLSLLTLFDEPRRELFTVAGADFCLQQSAIRDMLEADLRELTPECAGIQADEQQISAAVIRHREGVQQLSSMAAGLAIQLAECAQSVQRLAVDKASIEVQRRLDWKLEVRGFTGTTERQMSGADFPNPKYEDELVDCSNKLLDAQNLHEDMRKDAQFYNLRLRDRQQYLDGLENQARLMREQLLRKTHRLEDVQAELAVARQAVADVERHMSVPIELAARIAQDSLALYKVLLSVKDRVCSIYQTAFAEAAFLMKSLLAYEHAGPRERVLLIRHLQDLRVCREHFASLGPERAAAPR